MTGRWVGVLSLIAVLATALNLHNSAGGSQTTALSTPSQVMLAQAQTAVVGNGSASASAAADAQCPKANSEEKTGYYPDKPRNADFQDQGYTYHNLYGKPCQGPFVKAFCRKESFCDGSMSGSQCESNGVWGACKEESAAPVQVACSTPAGCATGQLGNTPTTPASPATPAQTPPPTSPANTQPTTPPAGSSPAAPAQPAPPSPANSGISAIANSGSQTPVPVPSSGSTPAGYGNSAAPSTPVPTGPAFQSTPYVSGSTPPPSGTVPAGAPTTPTVPTSPYNPPPGTWTPTYNSSRYSGGSSPVALATGSSGSALFFSGMFNLFGGLFTGGSSGSPGSSRTYATPVQTSAQEPVQNIIQLYVIGAPESGTTGPAKAVPAVASNAPQTPSYNITIPETPAVSLNGVTEIPFSYANFQDLLSLAESGTPADAANDETHPSSVSADATVAQTLAPSKPSTMAELAHSNTLNAALGATQEASSTAPATESTHISFVQPYAVSASAPASANGFSPTLNLIDIYAGGWTGGKVTDPAQALLENRAALAQLQTNYEGTQAALSAWQSLADAGLCAESCQTTIATLQSQLPEQVRQLKKLSDAVDEGTAMLSRTPAIDTGIAGLARNPEHAALLLNADQTVLSGVSGVQAGSNMVSGSGTSSDTAIQTIARYQLPPVSTSTDDGAPLITAELQSGHSSSGLPELLSHLWSILTNWFAPDASSTPKGIGCSLLGSLFGFCPKS